MSSGVIEGKSSAERCTMDSSFRALKENEREVLERLLEPKFPGRDELRAQLTVATAREIDEDGCIELDCRSASPAVVNFNIPSEGECTDVDGVMVHVQLHVVDGFMKHLEIYKEDGSIPGGLPAANELKLFAAYSEEAGVWTRSEKFR
jgi:hypothetical protein